MADIPIIERGSYSPIGTVLEHQAKDLSTRLTDSVIINPLSPIGFLLHDSFPMFLTKEILSAQGVNLSIYLDVVTLHKLPSSQSPIHISSKILKLINSKKATRFFREIKKLGCTFLLSDKDEIKR